MSVVPDITLTSLDMLTAVDVVTDEFLFAVEELQNATIANTEETVDITGKAGRKLNTIKRNKGVTISGAAGLLSGGMMEIQTGGQFKEKETEIKWTEYLTVASDKATTTYKGVGTAGAEIGKVYVKNSANGSTEKVLEQNATADATGHFAYSPENKELTFFAGDIADGSEIAVYYTRKVKAPVLANMSDSYSGKVKLFIDATGEDSCSNVYHVQFFIPRADFNGNFDIAMGDSQTVHNFEASSLVSSRCGGSAANGALWTYTVFTDDVEDIA